MDELTIIQKTYDLIRWYVPHLTKLPREHKFTLGDRITTGLYDLLDGLLKARFAKNKRDQLIEINSNLDILRYQTRLLHDFKLINTKQYEYASQATNNIGIELGGWIKQQTQISHETSRKPLVRNNQL
jgi:23S rRNA-intervening sequence protein